MTRILPGKKHFCRIKGIFQVVSRLAGQDYYPEEGENGREEFVKMMRAYEDVCGLEVLTY